MKRRSKRAARGQPEAAFAPGPNVAVKVPPDEFERTVAFYRDVLGLEVTGTPAEGTVRFAFGGVRLWVDRVPTLSQAEVWLQVTTPDTAAAARCLEAAGVVRCDEIEDLGGLDGFWIRGPGGIVHLVSAPEPAETVVQPGGTR